MKKKLSFTIFFFIAGVVLAGIIITKAVQEGYRSRNIEKEVEDLRKEAAYIQSENEKIQKKIDYYNTPEFIEKMSKEKMNRQKPEEKVVIVNQTTANQSPEAEEQVENVQLELDIPNYKKWWNFFFKYN